MPGILSLLLRISFVHRLLVGAGIYLLIDLLFVATLILWTARAILGRPGRLENAHRPSRGRFSTPARALASLMCILFTAVPVRVAVIGSEMGSGFFVSLACAVRMLKIPLVFHIAGPLLTAACLHMSFLVWKYGYWTAAGRVHYSALGIGGAACSFLLLWWKLS